MISICLAAALSFAAELKVHVVFRNKMVMQRARVIPLSGTAAPGAEATVSLKGKTYTAKAVNDGKWLVELAPMNAETKPFNMIIKSGKVRMVVSNILVGEVIYNRTWRLSAIINAVSLKASTANASSPPKSVMR